MIPHVQWLSQNFGSNYDLIRLGWLQFSVEERARMDFYPPSLRFINRVGIMKDGSVYIASGRTRRRLSCMIPGEHLLLLHVTYSGEWVGFRNLHCAASPSSYLAG